MRAIRWWAAAAAALGASSAGAHELRCEKTVNGVTYFEAATYPATLDYELVVRNVHPTDASDVLAAEDDLFSSTPDAQFDAPFSLPLGAQQSRMFSVTENSFEACHYLASLDGVNDDFIDNVFTVTWESGQRQCMARVACRPEQKPEGPTRTMGFYKTRIAATSQCLDHGGNVFLGPFSVTNTNDALGFYWGSPNHFEDGTDRSPLEQARFLLARQLLAATCNVRLFGTSPTDPTLLDQANAALCTTDTALMGTLTGLVDAYNNSGDAEPLPPGFDPGDATPLAARNQASDPTEPGLDCVVN